MADSKPQGKDSGLEEMYRTLRYSGQPDGFRKYKKTAFGYWGSSDDKLSEA